MLAPRIARALWFIGPGRVELRNELLPEPSADEVIARGLFSAVSHGTEGLLISGDAPQTFDPSLGDTAQDVYPRRYGYAWVGEVLGGALPVGTRVFSLATHADFHVLARDRLRILPQSVTSERATLCASLETALNAVWDSELCLGERVLVIGAGSIGLLIALLCQAAGAARVHVVDASEARGERARRSGIDDATLSVPPEAEFDVVFEATGNPAALDAAIAGCAFEGRIVVVSFYGTRTSAISLGERFHRSRLRLLSSQVSHLPARLRARVDYARRFELVLHWLQRLPVDELLSKPMPFDAVPAAYQSLTETSGAQILIEYSATHKGGERG